MENLKVKNNKLDNLLKQYEKSRDEIKDAIEVLKNFRKSRFFKSACLTVGSSAPQLNFTLIGVATWTFILWTLQVD
ncbi:hypothetical protein HYE07_02325 [Mycoplasmopsis bovis]|nr:hypothetical protein [Mycoplasmopsis bovis]QQH27344.1 hypothetical protein HYE07_02325 [Mycoplasmopsis bovis]